MVNREEERLAIAESILIGSNNWWAVLEIAELTGLDEEMISAQFSKWKHELKLFSIEINGVDLYPKYAFNHLNMHLPVVSLGPILEVFLKSKTELELACWSATPNGFLAGRKPEIVFITEPKVVLEAARDYMAGIQHG